MSVELTLRFDGRDADGHMLDMRLFGRSLIGLDRTLTTGIILLAEGREPRQREKLDFSVKVGTIDAKCVEWKTILEATGGVLPFLFDEISKKGPEFLWNLISYVLTMAGGKPKQADPHFMALLDFVREVNQSRDRSEERLHETVRLMFEVVRPHARDMVAPLGPSAEKLTIRGPRPDQATEVDVPMADAVRAKEPLEVGDMETITVHVDGITLHNRTIKIELPDERGRFLNAEVRDPAFDATPNPYKDAVGSDLTIDVKPTRRPSGELVRLYVMNITDTRSEAA